MPEQPPPEDDGLAIPKVGAWSRDKHDFLRRYTHAFTTSMRKKAWTGLHYIDLFAGAGIERIKGTNLLDWGSPMIAAQAPYPFTRLHLCDKNRRNYEALTHRMAPLELPEAPQILHGDANQEVGQIVSEIPPRSLSLAFLDPYGLHLDFDTLKVLVSGRRVDLIIFFPDHLDALRNCKYVYRDKPNSNLDRVLGPGADWRTRLGETPNDKWAEVLREIYVRQIAGLGYEAFAFERICTKGHPLYLLLFCSKHRLGGEIWHRVFRIKPDGQRTLDFGPDE